MIKQNIPQQQQEACCSLCGSNSPWKCEHCMGAMAIPPYMIEEKMFIGSGEDVPMFFDNNGAYCD